MSAGSSFVLRPGDRWHSRLSFSDVVFYSVCGVQWTYQRCGVAHCGSEGSEGSSCPHAIRRARTDRHCGRSVGRSCGPVHAVRRERDMIGRPYTSNVPVPLRLEPGSRADLASSTQSAHLIPGYSNQCPSNGLHETMVSRSARLRWIPGFLGDRLPSLRYSVRADRQT